MKVIRLSASNVMRLKAVEIEPNGTVQIVAGKNGAGKSSLLNALYLALAGGQAARDIAKPIRAGEEWAEVKLDLGTIIVTRSWDEKGTKLTVKAADGATYKTPQTLLDSLLGALTFDPLEFTRQKPAEQRATLLELLGLDFEAEDAERKRLYDLRLETGRQSDRFGELARLDKHAPMVEIPATEILDRINAANRVEQQRRSLEHQQQERRARIDLIDQQIAELRDRIAKMEIESAAHSAAIISLGSDIAELPEPADMDALSAELAAAEERNRVVRANQKLAADIAAKKALDEQYTAYTHQIQAIDQAKADAIAAAEMPVDGLGFDDTGVLFRGMPFSQASSAEQIKVSLAMASAMNPQLRVARIMDGSLLDKESMAAVRELADQFDMQVFVEVVSEDPDDPTAIVISDGEVVR